MVFRTRAEIINTTHTPVGSKIQFHPLFS